MTSSAEAQSRPVYEFPGDSVITQSAYAECMPGRYGWLGSLVTDKIAPRLGVVPDKATVEASRRIVAVAALMDDCVDEGGRTDDYASILRYWRGEGPLPELQGWDDAVPLRTASTLTKHVLDELPEERSKDLIDIVERIGEIGREKADCTSRWKYVGLLWEEGNLSGRLVTDTASEEVYDQPGYKKMRRYTARAMGALTIVDSTMDLEDDYANKLTLIEPKRRNKFLLGAAAVAPSFAVLVGSPRATADIVRLGMTRYKIEKARSRELREQTA